MAVILENRDDIFRFKSYLFNYPQKCTYKIESINGNIEKYSILESRGVWYIGEIYSNRIQKRTWYGKKYFLDDCLILGKIYFNNNTFIAYTSDVKYLKIVQEILENIPITKNFSIYPIEITYKLESQNSKYYSGLEYQPGGYYKIIEY